MRFAPFFLVATLLSGSDARFTDELWIQVESLHQQHLAHKPKPTLPAIGKALKTLAEKAPREEWREALIARASEFPQNSSDTYFDVIQKKPFPEGLAAILARVWIPWELSKDPSTEACLAQLTRMMNSVAGPLDDAARARVKQAFLDAAREVYGQ